MPTQDAQGRWISDDGRLYWDGTAWRPTGAAPKRGGISAVPAVLIGCAFALIIVLILGIGGIVFVVTNADFQRGFCNGYTSSDQNLTCPFHPPSP